MDNEKKIALLIDGDNIPVKYVSTILDELTSNYGVISVKRAYGDWSSETLKPWKQVMLQYSISAIQQFSYTSKKNSTDSAMIIDAMDILYTKDIDIFCLATSDCDFIRIASRLRESGKTVIGMGESNKTIKSFISACNEFKFIDLLYNDDSKDKNSSVVIKKDTTTNSVAKKSEIKRYIIDLVSNTDRNDNRIIMSGVKTSIKNKFPGFDERNYGFSKFSTFINSFKEFGTETTAINNYLILKTIKTNNDVNIKNYIIKSVKGSKTKLKLTDIHNLLQKYFEDFSLKSLGYSRMKTFISSIPELTVDENGYVTLK